jgi:predicted amidohydrolase YtcJ
MRRTTRLALAALPLAVLPLRAQTSAPATLLVVNARIHTVNDASPEAEVMAVRGGRVVWIGSAADAARLRLRAKDTLDAGGRTVIPGITDAHGHLLELGQRLGQVDLTGTSSYAEVVARIAEKARTLPKGAWVLGGGWDQNDWADKRFPTHAALDAAVPDRPVMVSRVDGHAVLANAVALRAAGVTAATTDPLGGRLEREAGGAPTGVFVDNAMALVERVVPAATAAQRRAAVLAAVKEANRWGLTGVHDAGEHRATIDTYEALAREGRFTLRDYVMVSDDSADLAHYFRRGPQSALYDGRLWIRAVKLYADGALGSRGAALLAPYSDDSTNRGLLVSTPAHLERVAEQALRAGFQVNVHAIGDGGNRTVLDAFEKALAAVPTKDARLRIEHAQIVSPEDIPRFASLGVIPSMQASHQTSDMYWAEQRLGAERIRGAYAWRSLLDTKVIIPNGSDFPVERVNPLYSFHAAFTRQDEKSWPEGGWHPEQRMTRDEALRSITIWPARAAFQERVLGSLEVGKYADFVVLSQDIMSVAPEQVLATTVVATYLAGRPVYEAAKP